MTIRTKLRESDDDVIDLQITDKHGEKYLITLEMLNHGHDVDEISIRCYKMSHDDEMVKHPNRILYNEKPVYYSKGYAPLNVWFEFHEMDDLPAVKS